MFLYFRDNRLQLSIYRKELVKELFFTPIKQAFERLENQRRYKKKKNELLNVDFHPSERKLYEIFINFAFGLR